MTLVAVHAVIDIPADIGVLKIGCISAAMATRALKNGVVIRIGMARRADSVRAAMSHRPPRVIERSPRPRRSGVAGRASRREHRRRGRMDRIRGSEVVRFMAAVAIGRQCRVVVVYMAVGARHRSVRAGQRKCCRAVIECAVRPQCGVVAELAGRREAHLNVVDRRGRVVIVGQMARGASRIRAG